MFTAAFVAGVMAQFIRRQNNEERNDGNSFSRALSSLSRSVQDIPSTFLNRVKNTLYEAKERVMNFVNST